MVQLALLEAALAPHLLLKLLLVKPQTLLSSLKLTLKNQLVHLPTLLFKLRLTLKKLHVLPLFLLKKLLVLLLLKHSVKTGFVKAHTKLTAL
jgi:hypothetical protein